MTFSNLDKRLSKLEAAAAPERKPFMLWASDGTRHLTPEEIDARFADAVATGAAGPRDWQVVLSWENAS